MTRLVLLLLVIAASFAHASEGSVTPIIPSAAPRNDQPKMLPPPGTSTPAPNTVAHRVPTQRRPARDVDVTIRLLPGQIVTWPGVGRFGNPTATILWVRLELSLPAR